MPGLAPPRRLPPANDNRPTLLGRLRRSLGPALIVAALAIGLWSLVTG